MIFRKWWNIIILSQTLCIFSGAWEKKEISGKWREKQVQGWVSVSGGDGQTQSEGLVYVWGGQFSFSTLILSACKNRQTRESQWAWTWDQKDASSSQESGGPTSKSLQTQRTDHPCPQRAQPHDTTTLDIYTPALCKNTVRLLKARPMAVVCSGGFTKHYQIIPLQNSNCVWGSVTCPRVCPYIQW